MKHESALNQRHQIIAMLSLALLNGSFCTASDEINFNRDIRPILSDRCFACHGLDRLARKADLRLDQRDAAMAAGAIVPGEPDQSPLVERIFSHDDDTIMPPPKFNKPLTLDEKNLLRRWIEEGAVYQPHWSFIPLPEQISIPPIGVTSDWVKSPIDAFVLDRLTKEGVAHASEATRETWLRRVSFDLTGLPPSPAELNLFLADSSPQAYEKVVDRLLGSLQFGERMANEWLDVARYADTFGYQSDRDTHLWPWRDWVIRAFNDNLPYDQFITWQTAGDLLPDATPDQRLATAFNRLHRQTNEGGSVEEEFRQSYIADRVVTNGTAFLGLTFECARCHDHKYDPISQADFYSLAAFFANIDEHGLYSHFTETAPTPTIPLYNEDQKSRHIALKEKIRQREEGLKQIRTEASSRFADHPLSKLTTTDVTTLAKFVGQSTDAAPQPANLNEPQRQTGPVAKLHLSFDSATPNGDNTLVEGVSGQAIKFGGDDAFPGTGSGEYGRTSPFSISVWIKPAELKPRVILLHQCLAAEDAAFRGYSMVLDNEKLQFSLIHFWPGNAIQVESEEAVRAGEWTHIAVTYDGGSHAEGVHIYLNGQPARLSVVRDKLTRDIRYRKESGDYVAQPIELSLGARMRDVGFRGGAIDELFVFDQELSALEVLGLSRQVTPPGQAPLPETSTLAEEARFEHYLLRFDEPYRQALSELTRLRREENELASNVVQIMAMVELPQPRETRILKRGAYDAPGDVVTANVPSSILPFPEEAPRNRLGLARWMTNPQHPLTSRVAVNRLWSLFFGRGLTVTVEDFGGQGQSPSHPELLDWLARDFVEHGWNVKRFCKQVVLSATYRQSSQPGDPKLLIDDPDNKLLARGPRYRLSAEQLRDNALAVSGLLVTEIGGPSVMPYQPAGLWEEAGTGKHYVQSHGPGLYRRSLYTFWRRTSPPPNMLAFDATGREVCTARRERTATPLQALVLLNDPQFVEAARVLAEKLTRDESDSVESRLLKAFRQVLSRQPSPDELQILTRLYRDQQGYFASAPETAREFLSVGETPRNEHLDPTEVAALAVVVETLLNFDECVTKR
ncbi:DUF1553 domain-containing protein [Schlesneria sp. DSM 10557]|uniref:DUF1553 domain-containing protein n=1 Tax=Schlesneria sp. DSM 10557 TaxID=3044399 RepID=UPI00359F972A